MNPEIALVKCLKPCYTLHRKNSNIVLLTCNHAWYFYIHTLKSHNYSEFPMKPYCCSSRWSAWKLEHRQHETSGSCWPSTIAPKQKHNQRMRCACAKAVIQLPVTQMSEVWGASSHAFEVHPHLSSTICEVAWVSIRNMWMTVSFICSTENSGWPARYWRYVDSYVEFWIWSRFTSAK